MSIGRKYSFIFEQTTVVPVSEMEIIEESTTSKGDPKIAFKSRLQESDVKNNNRRIYKQSICESIVNSLSPKAKSNSLLMEIDHPMFFSGATDPVKMKQRAAVVEINNCGAKIRNLNFKNGQILGEIETLSSFKGPDLANLISKDKVDIGFSLRALGGVEPMRDGTLMVKDPIMPITYDVVSNPSHANAKVLEFLPETDLSLIEESTSLLYEGQQFDLESLEEDVQLSTDTRHFKKFVDDIIAEQFIDIVSKNIRFNI